MTVTINGSGTVTGITAGGLPNGIITQPEMATGVAGTGPAFSAYANATVSVSNSVVTKVTLNSEEFDTNSNFDSATNYRFTPTVAGYYQINCNISLDGSSVNPTAIYLYIYKNGSPYKLTYDTGPTMQAVLSISHIVSLNGSTDYVEMYCQLAGATGGRYAGAIPYTSMSGCLVRAA